MDTGVYNEEWFEYLERFDPHIETALLAVFAHLGVPDSLIDFGAGTCATVNLASGLLIDSTAVEISNLAKEYMVLSRNAYFIKHDLTRYFMFPDTYVDDLGIVDYEEVDLVICWEVAEHLPPESADILCDTLAKYTGKYLVFTAAHEGQGGQYHLNEQNMPYWEEKLESRGLSYMPDKTEQLRETWKWATGPMHWLPENVAVFERVVND